jgi:protein-S-isoprenylcysteine O-methyltransferase Ste14
MRRRLPWQAVVLVWSAGVLGAQCDSPGGARPAVAPNGRPASRRAARLVSAFLLFADPLLATLTGVFAVALNRAARLEEAALAARFGEDWREYAARTPRWIGIATLP